MKSQRMLVFLSAVVLLIGLVFAPGGLYAASTITFTGDELLGKPTNNSITINIVPASTIEYHYQYGTTPGAHTVADIQPDCHWRPAP